MDIHHSAIHLIKNVYPLPYKAQAEVILSTNCTKI